MDVRHLRVLLVEDDEDDYLITEDLLSEVEGTSFNLVWAPDYEAALETIHRETFDVCLFDYRLGARSGIELLREVVDGGNRTPVIMLTGQGDRAVDLEAMEAGASDYLVKGELDAPLLDRSIRYAVESKRTEDELREAEERFRSAFENAAIGMSLTASSGRFLQVNQALCKIVGYPEEELLARTFEDITHPEDMEVTFGCLRELLSGEADSCQIEKRYLHKDGHAVWVLLSVSPVRDASGELLYFISQVQDVTERKRLQERLEHEATHDPLTGLPNRALFNENLERALAR